MMQTKKSLIRYYAPALVGLLIIIVLLALPTGFESGLSRIRHQAREGVVL